MHPPHQPNLPVPRRFGSGHCALLLLAWLGLFPGEAPATTEAGGRFEPWHVMVTRSVTSTLPSPDGRWIAYTLAVPRRPLEEDSGPDWSELHVVGSAGGPARGYVTGKVNVSALDWTPDGRISYLAKRDGEETAALWAIPVDGGESKKLIAHDTDIDAYSWHPDGQRVAFLAKQEVPEEVKTLGEKGFNAIVYEEDRPYTRLYLARIERGRRDGEPEDAPLPRPLDLEGSVRSVEYNRDGSRLMVTVTPTPLIDDTYVSQTIRILDGESGQEVGRIDNPGKLGAVEWSPDGAWIAMVSAADRHDPAEGRLMVAPAAGGDLRDLLPGLPGHVQSLAWQDDETVLYVADRDTQTEVGAVALGGGAPTPLIAAGSTVLSSIRVSRDGAHAAFVGAAPQHPPEAFVLDREARSARRLTSSNDWLDDVPLQRQEVVRYRARDGLELEGILIYPAGYDPQQRYPLILVIHGGPESHFRNAWLTGYSSLGQVAAARGFAVFYPNYRGSTGRGVEFSKVSQADAAGPEFDDYVDAVDHLIAIGLVDRDRVGITGGSYGGYASAWATTFYSDRFAAAAPFVGISDTISKMGTTDIPHEMYEVHHRKWLWEDWDYFTKRSPIYWVTRNRTPTLILHGQDDPRVHPSQSLELYRHLKVLGQAPVRLVLYPGEGHGNVKSAGRFDYLLRVLGWMEHYLKGPGGEPPPYRLDYAAALPWGEASVKESTKTSDEGAKEKSTGPAGQAEPPAQAEPAEAGE